MFGEPLPAILVRWGSFVAILVTIGATAFGLIVLGLLARRAEPTAEKRGGLDPFLIALYRRRTAVLGCLGAVTLIPFAVGRLMIQVSELRDVGQSWKEPATMMLFETAWGAGWWMQAGAALLCAIGFLLVRRDDTSSASARRDQGGWLLAALGSVALAMTPALSGHAVGTPRFMILAVAGDTLHVLGAGAWIGSLAIMFGAVVRARPQGQANAAAIGEILRVFSPVALVSAGLVVSSGIVASWLHLGTLAALWDTAYGRRLVGKVTLFSIVAALGAWNWRRVTPRLQSHGDVEALDRAARTELLMAFLVLFATAVLVATPLPGE